MAININLTKPAPQTEVETAVEEQTVAFDPRVDEIAALLAWEAKMKKDPKAVRLAELKKEFAAEANAEGNNDKEEVIFEGEKNRYRFGDRADVRSVTVEGKEKFANLVGEAAFLQCATIALKDIDQYVAKSEQGDYLDYSKGSRTGKVEAKIAAKK